MNTIAISKNTRLRRCALVVGAVLVTLPGVTANRSSEQPVKAPQQPVTPQTPQALKRPHHHWYQVGWHQVGRASWYGQMFQGHETASGEDFNMNAMTCAHRSLPMGSVVKVTNLRNHKSVVVRVNDRGPIPDSRVIDLSYAAARLLGFSNRGTAPVRLELIGGPQLAQMAFPANRR
ncbi:MAG: septal ring lytic transglycosylase RlpA family protein [Acidobacteriaceae bacterium]